MGTTRAGTAAAADVVLLGSGPAGRAGEGLGGGTGSGAGSDGAPTGSALKAVADLPMKGRPPKAGYARDEFGAAWVDTEHNGCDTRVASVLRQATGVFVRLTQGLVGCAC